MHHSPGTTQEYLRCKAHFEAFPRAPCSLCLFALEVWSQRYWLSVIQAGTPVHKTQNSALTVHRVHLATAYVGLKKCAVTKEFCKHRLPGVNRLSPELNPICYLLALLAHDFFHVSRIRVKSLTLRLLMSHIYGAPILDVSKSHTTTQHSR
jgi:hypothetical protein